MSFIIASSKCPYALEGICVSHLSLTMNGDRNEQVVSSPFLTRAEIIFNRRGMCKLSPQLGVRRWPGQLGEEREARLEEGSMRWQPLGTLPVLGFMYWASSVK